MLDRRDHNHVFEACRGAIMQRKTAMKPGDRVQVRQLRIPHTYEFLTNFGNTRANGHASVASAHVVSIALGDGERIFNLRTKLHLG